MNKNEFLQKFKLHQLQSSTQTYRYQSTLRTAAVLVGIIDDGEQLNVLFTKRAKHLRHHPGQVSFPGGKTERFDDNLIATATREAQEEIGLSPDVVRIVGQLHPYQTVSGYVITPIIAFIPYGLHFTKDKNEVSEIFTVPLKHFLSPQNHYSVVVHHYGEPHNVHFMPYEQHNIWGATAAILKDLALHLS